MSPASKAVIDAIRLKQLDGPSTALRVIGGASENEALAVALHELVAWDERHSAVLDAIEADLVRQLPEKVERRLAAAEIGASATPQRARPRLH